MATIEEAQAEGKAAAQKGSRRSSNPHPPQSEEWTFWMEAFDQETAKLDREVPDRRGPDPVLQDRPASSASDSVYRSANGDDWLLEYDAAGQVVAVVHQANAASGGARTRLAVDEFLQRSGDSPEAAAVRVALSH
ncbi:hypothetical protein [Aureimonas sp. ME7]|uniref:hypothetical protein n=1 Tax=Aureimonas sp. ME7 TaxID=2744252 RepID=UPI0015FAC533|nr:hypothetical protein [Aureimonas sp. ME7]